MTGEKKNNPTNQTKKANDQNYFSSYSIKPQSITKTFELSGMMMVCRESETDVHISSLYLSSISKLYDSIPLPFSPWVVYTPSMLSPHPSFPFQCLKGAYKKAEEALFTSACRYRTRDNGVKLE